MIIHTLKDKYPISTLCNYFEVSRSGYYKWVKSGCKLHYNFCEDIAKMIRAIFDHRPKGYRYVNMQLKRKYGLIQNPKTTLRYMQILGLKSSVRKRRYRYTTPSEAQQKSRIVSPNILNRDFKADKPLEKLVTDVSYIYHKTGRLYLSVIKDLYDNSILAYNISKFNDYSLVYDNVKQILNEYDKKLSGAILHSDQGYQYTLRQFNIFVTEKGIITSNSRKGNCYDNSPCENFFSHLKSEELNLNIPKTEYELVKSVDSYIYFYNNDRPQQKLNGMTPIEFRYHA